MIHLAPPGSLPPAFRYPEPYLRMASSATQPDLYPWRLLGDHGSEIPFFLDIVRKRYPDKVLIPFARRDDSASGDLACFDGDDATGNPKIYFHVFGDTREVPWTKRFSIAGFSGWLQEAQQEAEEYRTEMAARQPVPRS